MEEIIAPEREHRLEIELAAERARISQSAPRDDSADGSKDAEKFPRTDE
jgi:hypothetical protein